MRLKAIGASPSLPIRFAGVIWLKKRGGTARTAVSRSDMQTPKPWNRIPTVALDLSLDPHLFGTE